MAYGKQIVQNLFAFRSISIPQKRIGSLQEILNDDQTIRAINRIIEDHNLP